MTALVNLLNRPILRSRTEENTTEEDRHREVDLSHGIILQPWMITLIISLITGFVTIAVVWGTITARLDSIDSRLNRLERITDADRERTRGPANHVEPALNFSNPSGLPTPYNPRP